MPIVGCGRGKYRKPKASLRPREERDLLVLQWMPMAKGVATEAWKSQEWIRQRKSLEDLQQDAFHGLIRAAELWDPARLKDGAPVQFQTYAHAVVERWIYRAAQQSGIIRMPHQIPVKEWPNHPASLVRNLPEDRDGKLIEMPGPAKASEESDRDMERLYSALMALAPDIQEMIDEYFGLSVPRRTLAEIAAAKGMTKRGVVKVFRRAFDRLGWELTRTCNGETEMVRRLHDHLPGQRVFAGGGTPQPSREDDPARLPTLPRRRQDYASEQCEFAFSEEYRASGV